MGSLPHQGGPSTALQHQARLFTAWVRLLVLKRYSSPFRYQHRLWRHFFFFLKDLPLRQIPSASIHWLVSLVEKAPENLSIPAPSRGAAEGTTVPRDLIANGQRGFSVETSKLEAIYFQPGFGGDLGQHLRCLAWGAPAPPIPDSKPVTGKGTPGVFLQILPSYWRGQKLSWGLPPLKGRRVCQGDAVGGYDLHLAHEGPTAERTSSSPKRARLTRPSTPGQEWVLLAFPADPLPLQLSL